jgi:hypothetical protein
MKSFSIDEKDVLIIKFIILVCTAIFLDASRDEDVLLIKFDLSLIRLIFLVIRDNTSRSSWRRSRY